MALILQLITENKQTKDARIIARAGETVLATTRLADLPDRDYTLDEPTLCGPFLFAALGGAALQTLLDEEPDNLLHLEIAADDPADDLAWECATLPDSAYLVHRYGLLRLADQTVTLDQEPAPLRLIALGADGLVDEQGQARDTRRLDILHELVQIEGTLAQSKKVVSGVRIAPTPAALQAALAQGQRSLLHLACHGGFIPMGEGRHPVLYLEDENGKVKKLLGSDLVSFATLADLRLILLNACHLGTAIPEAEATQSRLIRALVEQGVPAAIGMQGPLLDHLADDLAVALYRAVLNGLPLGKAVQAARLALGQDVQSVGLIVAYVARGGDGPIPLAHGNPTRQRLDLSELCRLPTTVQVPEPFLGRNEELYTLAKLAQHHQVITVIGTGGMGKTALAAAFARRFALRYTDGVLGYSFAATEVDGGNLRRDLLGNLLPREQVGPLIDASQEMQERAILDSLRVHDLLLVVDNYESVQQAKENPDHPQQDDAQAIHGLLRKIAQTGGRLLLTSRRQPAGLKRERVFPGRTQPLQGVTELAGVEIFYEHSPRALEDRHRPAIQTLARKVTQFTEGHPLAIALLGAEYDAGAMPPERFLAQWPAQLQRAQSDALDDHHATFATAFSRSFQALSPESQERLQAVALIPFPFFVNGAALLWEMTETDDEDFSQTQTHLRELVNRSFIEIELAHADNTPATWRFQPAVQQEALRHLTPDQLRTYTQRLAQYAAWLSDHTYGDIHQEGKSDLVRHIQPTLDALVELADELTGTQRLWHLRCMGWLLNAFGRTGDAYALLTEVLPESEPALEGDIDGDMRAVRSIFLYQVADLEVTRGDLDKALSLYKITLASFEKIGDTKGKAASLYHMAQVYLTRGDLDKALLFAEKSLASFEQIGDIQGKAASLHQMAAIHLDCGEMKKALLLSEKSLRYVEQIGDIQGKAALLHQMAQIYLTRGYLDQALLLFEESLALKEKIGNMKGKAASLHSMAQVYLTRGDLDKALSLYEDSLASFEQIGDKKGKAASLSMMANLWMRREDWDQAEKLIEEALAISQQLGERKGIAFKVAKLGLVAQTRGDLPLAREKFTEAHAIFQKLGMPGETAQVQGWLDGLVVG